MSDDLLHWGIDGCKAGWICIGLGRDNVWQHRIVERSEELLDLPRMRGSALIDIPIGLVDKGINGRGCDRAARKVLGFPRSCSVFTAPSRLCLDAGSYRAACEVNYAATGRKISRQAWAIAPKIREIDELTRSRAGRKLPLRECHPEVCFWALNNGKPMVYNKKTALGREERMEVLARYLPSAQSIVSEVSRNSLRKVVAIDDIVDALVAALTAKLGADGLQTLPYKPAMDKYRLPMEIVFASPRWRGHDYQLLLEPRDSS